MCSSPFQEVKENLKAEDNVKTKFNVSQVVMIFAVCPVIIANFINIRENYYEWSDAQSVNDYKRGK